MSEFDDVIKYLGENLKVDIRQLNKFSGSSFHQDKTIMVRLLIGDVVISESSCKAPQTYHGR